MDKNITIHNDFNFIGLKNFKEIELNLFFYIVKQINDKNDLEIKIKFRDLSNILKSNSSKKQNIDILLKDLFSKLQNLGIRTTTKNGWKQIVLFKQFEADLLNKELVIQVNDLSLYFFNNLSKNFTRFDFLIYLNLNGKYTKEIYRRIRQFHKTKLWRIKIEDFYEQLSIPKNYKFSNIKQKILNPSIEELREYYPDLEVSYIYEESSGKGRPKVKTLEFIFKESNYIIFNGQKINPDTGEIYEENSKPKLVTTIDKRIDELTEEELIELLIAKKAQKGDSQSWITDETKSILNRNFLKE